MTPSATPSTTPSTTSSQPPNFDRVARIYRWAEYLTLGPLLVRTRNHFLPQLTHCRRALILGDGDGRFTANLLKRQPHLHAFAVDTSATMLHLLRNRCLHSIARLQTLQASALDILRNTEPSSSGSIASFEKNGAGNLRLQPEVSPDLIATHFFLDCLTQPEVDVLTERLSSQLNPGTIWLLSDFGQPHPLIFRPLAALYIRALYFAFRILTGLRVTQLPDPQSALRNSNFVRIARHELLCGLLYTEIWQRQ